MLISDFIEKLEKFKTEVGNVQVLMRDEYGNVDDFDCFTSTEYNPFDGCNENIIILGM